MMRLFKIVDDLRKVASQQYLEIQSDIFRGSGSNASTDFDVKIPKMVAYMRRNGWGDIPPIRGKIQTIDENDVDEYLEAESNGTEHELDWSRPLTQDDVGTRFVSIYDGHNRAYAASEVGIPIRVI